MQRKLIFPEGALNNGRVSGSSPAPSPLAWGNREAGSAPVPRVPGGSDPPLPTV